MHRSKAFTHNNITVAREFYIHSLLGDVKERKCCVFKISGYTWNLSRAAIKPTKWSVCPEKTRTSLDTLISLRCPHEKPLVLCYPFGCTAKTLIRLGECQAWLMFSLGAQVILLFCRVPAHLIFGKSIQHLTFDNLRPAKKTQIYAKLWVIRQPKAWLG